MDRKDRAKDIIFTEKLWRIVKFENVYLQSYSDGITLYYELYNYFKFNNEEGFRQS
jgi:putative transposase